MSVALFTDVHVHRVIVSELRLRGVDVLRAQDDGSDQLTDDLLLDRATALNRVLLTYDDDLLVIASSRQRSGIPFSGLLFAHARDLQIGRCIDDLEELLKVGTTEDFANRVLFLTFGSRG